MRYIFLFLLAAVLVGLLHIGPPLMIWKNFKDAGNEFALAQYKTYRDSLQAYLPRAREIYDGHFPPAELYGEDRSSPTIQNPLPPLFFAGFLYLFKGNLNAAYLGAQFFFSAVIFSLFAFLGWLLWRSKLWAMFFGLVGTLTPIPLKLPFYKWQGFAEFQAFFLNNFIPFIRTQFDQLYLARIDEPLLTYPIYLFAIAAFFIFWRKPSPRLGVFAAIPAGLLFYTYFHHWVYWIIVLGIVFLLVLIFYRTNKALIKNFLIFWGCLAIITIPYFVTYFLFNNLDTAQDFVWRAGVTFGHTLGVGRENAPDLIVYLALIILTYLFYFKRNREKAVLFFGLILAMFAVWNIQLVIGYVPVPHFFRRSISPIIFIIGFDFLYYLFGRVRAGNYPLVKRFGVAVLILLSVFVVAKKAVNIFAIKKNIQPHLVDYYTFPNGVAESWRWINDNLSGEPRVISPSTLNSFYLASYTSVRPFMPTAFTTLLPMAEIEERYLISHKLFGVPEQTLRARLKGELPLDCSDYQCFPDKGSNLNDSMWNLYGNYFASRYGSFKNFIAKAEQQAPKAKRLAKAEELLSRYRELKTEWADFDGDYVYYGPLEKHLIELDLSKLKNLMLVYQNSSVEIYKIRR